MTGLGGSAGMSAEQRMSFEERAKDGRTAIYISGNKQPEAPGDDLRHQTERL